MKVLMVCHGYPPIGVAGVERLSAQAAGELIGRGHEVTVLTRQPSELPKTLALQRETRDGVPVVSVIGGGSSFERFPADEEAMERIFERMLIEVSPDVALITHLMHHSPGYVDLAHRWDIPVLLELHDFFVLCPRAHLERRSGDLCAGPEGGGACAIHCFGDQEGAGLRWPLRARSFAHALQAADTVTAPSRFLADAFASLRGSAAPIEIVENSVGEMGPLLRTGDEESPPLRLASIGVTVDHKGFQIVLEALRLAGLPAVSYVILGVALPPLSWDLQAAGDEIPGLELRLANGFQPRHLPALLADSDVVVVPSLVPETYSIVTREAFACGLPVIASRIGALPAAIDEGKNGWLVEPGNPVELAELLRRLHHDRGLLERAAAGARATAVTDVAARVDRLDGLLRQAIEDSMAGQRSPDEGLELGLMRAALASADILPAAQR